MRLIAAGATLVAALASSAAGAPEQVSIVARPSIVPANQRLSVFGSVDNGREGELVTVQAKECGANPSFFRDVASATTRAGGAWSTEFFPRISSTLRAVWNDKASAQITVRQRPSVSLAPRASGKKFYVAVGGKAQFWRKRVLIQRFGRRLGTWTNMRSVVLTETGGYPGSGEVVSWSEFKGSFPRGALLRAVFPLSQARPCYLAGYSRLLRT